MKRRIIAMMALVVMLALPVALYAQETDPESAIRALHDALHAKDIDAALTLLADDAVVTIAHRTRPHDVFTGKEAIRGWYEGLVAQNIDAELSNFQVDGDNVAWSSKISIDDWRGLGVAPLDLTSEGIVQDGKIKSYTVTLSEESSAKLQAAMAALPETGGAAFPTYASVMAFGGLAILGGLGLRRLRRRSHQ